MGGWPERTSFLRGDQAKVDKDYKKKDIMGQNIAMVIAINIDAPDAIGCQMITIGTMNTEVFNSPRQILTY